MKCLLSLLIVLIGAATSAQKLPPPVPGANRTSVYLPLLKGKRVAVFANPTSTIGNLHLVDSLRRAGINITVIFGPEHGFRGTADAGEKLGNYTDSRTGIPVVSLYGAKHRPSDDDLKNVDVILFDIQDVGVRFYTYISSLEELMNAAFEKGIPMMILDRPNPNGFYVDGPVLEPKYKSFVGMQPVPVVYGMTLGEYAMMLAGEKWLTPTANARHDYYKTAKNSKDTAFHFIVIKCGNYTHKSRYDLPVKPSPNLPFASSVYWYPSTCFFEGTVITEGRGTDKPFQYIGHPMLPDILASFTPVSREGAKEPKFKDRLCYGWKLPDDVRAADSGRLKLATLLNAYKLFPDKASFFIIPKSGDTSLSFFNKLAGTADLMQQVKAGWSEEQIRKSWQPRLQKFKTVRKKYLLYPDFE